MNEEMRNRIAGILLTEQTFLGQIDELEGLVESVIRECARVANENVVASGVGKSIFWSDRMNEQIKELCIKSGAYEHYEVNEGVNGDDLPMQKFAELIVQECLKCSDNLSKHYIENHTEKEQALLLASICDYSNEIKKHFGVEE